MTKNCIHIVFLLLGLVFTILLTDSCKPKKQEIPPTITVHIDVKDDSGKSIDTATAYLYTSKDAFDQAYQNSLNLTYSSAGSILTTKVINGQVDFQDLPSNAEYWVLIHQSSGSFVDANGDTIKGFTVDRDNSEAYYKIDAFQNGTQVSANIKLEPITSLIKFNNTSGSTAQLFLGNSTTSTTVPTSTSYVKVRKGDFGYQARTDACVWTGDINAQGGQVVVENLVSCAYGTVTFTYPTTLLQDQVVNIYIGQNKDQPIASIIAPNQSATVILAVGDNYSYFAETFVGKTRTCVDEGAFPSSVTNAGTVTVPLKVCQ